MNKEMNYTTFFEAIQEAGRQMVGVPPSRVDSFLNHLADLAVANTGELLAANNQDLQRMDRSNPKYDRLQLTAKRISDIAADLRKVATLPSPLGKKIQERLLTNGLQLSKVSVPIGVVGIIYEARPNVTFDVAALCLKSGNACILKGGSDAVYSNQAIHQLIVQALKAEGLPSDAVILLPAEREATKALLEAVGKVDILIPRGSEQLINFVRQNAKIPVIETGAGIVHTYVDEAADMVKAANIIHNAKTRRVSVCNALDCLLVHQNLLPDLIRLVSPLASEKVEIFADEKALLALQNHYPAELLFPAEDEHFGTEFLDYKMAIKVVASASAAMKHIARYSSKHSEAIITEDSEVADLFLQQVDAAAVYHNASTAFTDGAQFGMGAEIGISTQKLHARGPMALAELTSYKWLIRGNGQTRS